MQKTKKKPHKEKPPVRQSFLDLAPQSGRQTIFFSFEKPEWMRLREPCWLQYKAHTSLPKRGHLLEQYPSWCHPEGNALNCMGAEGHPGITMQCCKPEASQGHDAIAVRSELYNELYICYNVSGLMRGPPSKSWGCVFIIRYKKTSELYISVKENSLAALAIGKIASFCMRNHWISQFQVREICRLYLLSKKYKTNLTRARSSVILPPSVSKSSFQLSAYIPLSS